MYYQVNLSNKIAHEQCFFSYWYGIFRGSTISHPYILPKERLHTHAATRPLVRCRRQSWSQPTPLYKNFWCWFAYGHHATRRHAYQHTAPSSPATALRRSHCKPTACICFCRKIIYVNNYYGLFDRTSQDKPTTIQEFYMMKQSHT